MCELILLMMCYMAVPFIRAIKSHTGQSERKRTALLAAIRG